MSGEWAVSIRSSSVRPDYKYLGPFHRCEVYGEQFDNGEVVWWSDCIDCDHQKGCADWADAIAAGRAHFAEKGGRP